MIVGDTETITNAKSVSKYDHGCFHQQGLSYLNEQQPKKNKRKSTFFNMIVQKQKANANIMLLILFFCVNIL